ncbi:vgr related protein [Novosphingobium tardum]|uniref:Vgr related protein n=1 Tax=Novosphingobium tardum TaxID=1538021 RepID=A0ABV8RPK0_9SPHN
MGGARPLTSGEIALAQSVFGSAIDYSRVSIRRRKFFPFQPRQTAMAPRGHLHFHPRGDLYTDDFAGAPLSRQALFIHELTHVWQAQQHGSWWLVAMRHPLCRYDYAIRPGWPLARYGIEQQAEIVKHTFLAERGHPVAGSLPAEAMRAILPFRMG